MGAVRLNPTNDWKMLLQNVAAGAVAAADVSGLGELRLTVFTAGLRNIFTQELSLGFAGSASYPRFVFFDHTDKTSLFASVKCDGGTLTVQLTDSAGTANAVLYVEGR